MQCGFPGRLSQFLRDELALSPDSMAIAQRHLDENPDSVPMVLWQYGLVNLDQLDRIFDWLDHSQTVSSSLTDV